MALPRALWGCAWRNVAAGVAVAFAAVACGGGGGGGASSSASGGDAAPDPDIVDTATVAGRCAVVRPGSRDLPGTSVDEKRWLRSWIDDTYLWFDEVPTLRAADYATTVDYFDVLKTPALTASGRPKDRFHFSYDTAAYEALSNGIAWGYGIQFAYLSSQPPRDIRVAYVEPGSPAEAAGVVRGMRLVAADGIDAVEGANVDGLNAALAPATPGQRHDFAFRAADGSDARFEFTSSAVATAPVMNVKTLPTDTGPVGYLQFNQHSVGAEADLMDAVAQLRDSGITDLVIDMRYNGGGLLGIAAELASMVAPANASVGQTFERMVTNRKNPFGWSQRDAHLPFYGTAQYGVRRGSSLPRLNLSRVLVLSGGATCSASESVVNGLRGIGVQVDLVGGATCGKPYGFFPQDNCGTTYFAVQFQGVNARGQGDYADGLMPTCAVADDFDHALGDPAEARLAAALELRRIGQCPAPVIALAADSQKMAAGAGRPAGPSLLGPRAPWLDNRIVLPQDLAPH